jgi:hypothetical protein
MRTDNKFVSQFKKGFLDEVKHQGVDMWTYQLVILNNRICTIIPI